MINIFNLIFYQPLFNVLIFLYNTVAFHDFGVAVILLTILIRIIIYPLTKKMMDSQKGLIQLQPQINEIKKKFKTQEEQGREIMKLYKEKKINPFSSCLLFIVQIPILIALYQVFIKATNPESLDMLYTFINKPEKINTLFLGLINLEQTNVYLAVLAGISQFFQTKTSMINNNGLVDTTKNMNKQMLYFMPIITIIFALKFQGGLALYWLMSNIISIIQQIYGFRKK